MEIDKVVGEYRVELTLGEGGMGTVYGARHPLIGKRAAIKIINRELCSSPEAIQRFVLEAQSVNRIGHPNIVDVFAFGTLPDGRCYLVMEWLRGETLRERLTRGRLSLGEAATILDDVTRALEAAHAAGVVHRDLKPDNVFLVAVPGERPQVKLLDFGLAKLCGAEDLRTERTRVGVAMGTPQYISPEQAGGCDITAATDVYALGAMAYEMLLGRPPFVAATPVETMSMHITHRPVAPRALWPEIPSALDALLLQMLAKDPRDRPSPTEVRATFSRFSIEATTTRLLRIEPGPTRRWQVAAVVASGAFLGTALGAALVLGSKAAAGAQVAIPDAAVADAPVVTPDAPAPIGTLAIDVNVPDAQIVVDDWIVARAADRATVELAPGEHVVEVSAPQRTAYRSAVTVGPGTQDLHVTLEPPPRPRKRRASKAKPAPAVPAPDETTETVIDVDRLGDPFATARERAP